MSLSPYIPSLTSGATNKSSNRATSGVEHVQLIQHYIHLFLSYFPYLKEVPNVENIILAQAHYESRYDPAAASGVNSARPGTAGHSYVTDPVYGNGFDQGYSVSILQQGLQGWGLGQVLGMYLYRGTKVGKEFMQGSTYYGLANGFGLIVPIGTDLRTIFTRDDIGIQRGLISQMITLDNKYRIFRESKKNNHSASGNWDAFVRGLRSYLGDSTTADINGVYPTGYADSILRTAHSPPMTYASSGPSSRVAATNSASVTKPASGCA